jgi:hypothetical protein
MKTRYISLAILVLALSALSYYYQGVRDYFDLNKTHAPLADTIANTILMDFPQGSVKACPSYLIEPDGTKIVLTSYGKSDGKVDDCAYLQWPSPSLTPSADDKALLDYLYSVEQMSLLMHTDDQPDHLPAGSRPIPCNQMNNCAGPDDDGPEATLQKVFDCPVEFTARDGSVKYIDMQFVSDGKLQCGYRDEE